MTSRRYDIDALRAIVFAIVILYHICMLYVAPWHFHIKSPHTFTWLQEPMIFFSLWRMDLVFLISGLSLGFLQRGDQSGLLRLRSRRLLIPLLVGMVVVIPFQAYAQAVSNGSIQPGFGDFLLRYLRFERWPKNAFDGSGTRVTWNHLWYLPYLWFYTMLVLIGQPLIARFAGAPAQWVKGAFLALRGWRLLVLPLLPFFLYTVTLRAHFPQSYDLIHDHYRNAVYFTLFLFGNWMGVQAQFWAELLRLRLVALGVALGAFAVFIVQRRMGFSQGVGALLADVYLWSMIVAILGFAHHYLNRPRRWLTWSREQVFPWYIWHQTVLIFIAFGLGKHGLDLGLGALAEFALVLGGTVLLCWGLTDGLIRRVTWLRPLFGLASKV